MRSTLLRINDFNLDIDSNRLISGLNLSLQRGKRVGITGPSGCGKTTLLKTILKEHSKESVSPNLDIRKDLRIAFMPQSKGLLPWFSLVKNLSVFSDDTELIEATLQNLGLSNSRYSFSTQMSGGEYQRALLATAMVSQAELIIADEPLTELDLANKWRILEYWSKNIVEIDTALLLVSHDIETLIYLCDEIVILTDKPSNIKGRIDVSQAHPRPTGFIVSDKYLGYKLELVKLLNM